MRNIPTVKRVYCIPDIRKLRWPCPEWFHVPTVQDVIDLNNMFENIWLTWEIENVWTYLFMPEIWSLWNTTWSLDMVNNEWYHTCELKWPSHWTYKWHVRRKINLSEWTRASNWRYIRPFKDVFVTPDSSRITLYTNWDDWIYHNQTLWIITLKYWTTYITIADKNLWATTIYNYWDSQTQSNSWWFFQWWNNYMFPFSWATNTSWTLVDVSWYLPSTYSDNTFITTTWNNRWDNNNWDDLRWWVSRNCWK